MKIIGIGNALVDVLVKLPDANLLSELGIDKGSMNLVDEDLKDAIMKKISSAGKQMTTGGSISNTMLALRNLGEPSSFIGKVGNDDLGEFYLREMTGSGVTMHVIYEDQPSGCAVAMITPDGERTFCTYLGAAANMRKQDLKNTYFESYTHLYVEGYLVQNHELIETAMQIAKSFNQTVMLDLASFNVVAADRDFLMHLIDNYVDIVFANEDEATALTGKPAAEAIHDIAHKVKIAVVKEGDRGSWIKKGHEIIHVPVYRKIHPVDTTAAGDYYAAGFFYGLIHGANLEKCAETGSLLSYYIIQVVGTKLQDEVWTEIRTKVNEIIGRKEK
ncbi:MAG: adenosine kinase [Dysgonamonadaceae bacterium]|jgi:sugar/nucleoside kinase (ribokinase family)|nr:adenosine kinase [Dysgonamonadaceae bacterium]